MCEPLSTLRIRYRMTLRRWPCAPNATPMEGGPSARDSSRPHGGMSGESGPTGGVLRALGVVASQDRALLLTGS